MRTFLFIFCNLCFTIAVGTVYLFVKTSILFSNFDSVVQVDDIPYLVGISLAAFLLIYVTNFLLNGLLQKNYKAKHLLVVSLITTGLGSVIGSSI
jgi:hypothetical protein